MGKGFEKKIDRGTCITESFCCTSETNTVLLINSYKMKIKNKGMQTLRLHSRPIKAESSF